MSYSVKRVMDHYEVYGADGSFLFSADNHGEIEQGLEEYEAA